MSLSYPHHLQLNCLSVHQIDALKVESQIGQTLPVTLPRQQTDHGLYLLQSLPAHVKEDDHSHIHTAITTFDTLGELCMGREETSRFQYWAAIADILKILEEVRTS